MALEFVQEYGGCRLDPYEPQPPLEDEPTDDEPRQPGTRNLSREIPGDEWEAIDITQSSWRVDEWPERPVRFIDGSDKGEEIAWVRSPGGYPAPIRLAQIGAISIRVENGECIRESRLTDTVISVVTSPFPWQAVEGFASELQENGYRLLPAELPDRKPSYDFEKMRKPTVNRTNDEMRVFEEAVIAYDDSTPTIIDGLLEPKLGGFDPATSPVFGVVKTHHRNYLHPRGIQLLYRLEAGQRTPYFTLPEERPAGADAERTARRLPVVSWYVRLAGGGGSTPNWGVVRVEVAKKWFDARGCDSEFVNRLSRVIFEYRCRERSYARWAVSLHPIVRAEESLKSLFYSPGGLVNRFYRLAGL